MRIKSDSAKLRLVAVMIGREKYAEYRRKLGDKNNITNFLSREDSAVKFEGKSEDEKRRLVAEMIGREDYAEYRRNLLQIQKLQRFQRLRRTPMRPPSAPYVGRFLICLFIQPDKQEDRLADFEEKLNEVWVPQFGRTVGQVVYVCHAIRSSGAIVRIGLTAAIVDRITRAFGW